MIRRRYRYEPRAERCPLAGRQFVVVYQFAGDHPWANNEHVETDPVRLVRWMASHFKGSEHIFIKRLFEEGPDHEQAG